MANPAANATGHLAAHGMHPCVVTHGATAGTARPAIDSASDAITTVWWVGSVAPTNAVTGDHWTDTANFAIKRYNGSSWDSLAASGSFLARVVYTAGTTKTTTSVGTLVDVDATNLVITFVAPPSGEVKVTLSGNAWMSAAFDMYWGLRDAGGEITATGYSKQAATDDVNGGRAVCSFFISGLTSGTSYTWKWGWAVAAASTASLPENSLGAPTMEVQAV